jgi:hypothetical protein
VGREVEGEARLGRREGRMGREGRTGYGCRVRKGGGFRFLTVGV